MQISYQRYQHCASTDFLKKPDGTLDRHPVCICGQQVRPEIDMKTAETERVYFHSDDSKGVDLRSMLDEIYESKTGEKSDRILSLREEAIEIGVKIGNPEWREDHKEELKEMIIDICERYEKSATHEEAVDIGEKEFYGIEDNEWENVIDDVVEILDEPVDEEALMRERINEYFGITGEGRATDEELEENTDKVIDNFIAELETWDEEYDDEEDFIEREQCEPSFVDEDEDDHDPVDRG